MGRVLPEYRRYIRAGSEIIAIRAEGSLVGATPRQEYLLKDHLGSTVVVTDATGAVLDRLSYDPWGKRRNATGNSAPSGAWLELPRFRGRLRN
jgi:hypothetical protein